MFSIWKSATWGKREMSKDLNISPMEEAVLRAMKGSSSQHSHVNVGGRKEGGLCWQSDTSFGLGDFLGL